MSNALNYFGGNNSLLQLYYPNGIDYGTPAAPVSSGQPPAPNVNALWRLRQALGGDHGEASGAPRTDIGDPNGFMARAMRGFMGIPDPAGFSVARGVGQAAGVMNPLSTVTSIGGRLMGSTLLDNRVDNAAWAKTPSLPSQSAMLAQTGPLGGYSTEFANRPDLRNYSPNLATLLKDRNSGGGKSGPGGRDGRGGSRGPGDSRGGSGYGGGGTKDRGNSGTNASGGKANK